MSAATQVRPAAGPTTIAGRVTNPRVVRSEWTKFRSLRSTWWSLGSSIALTIGLGALIAAQTHADHGENLTAVSLAGMTFTQMILAVLGVLLIGGEYGTGMIRASLTAVPRRFPVLAAKAAVYVGVVLPAMLVTSTVTVLVADAIWSAGGTTTSGLSDPSVQRAAVGSALYVTVAGLLALAVGTILRHTAAGLGAVVALFFVAPVVAAVIGDPATGIGRYLPSNAGGALWGQTMTPEPLAPWTGFAVLCVYAVVALAVAAWRLQRTDA